MSCKFCKGLTHFKDGSVEVELTDKKLNIYCAEECAGILKTISINYCPMCGEKLKGGE